MNNKELLDKLEIYKAVDKALHERVVAFVNLRNEVFKRNGITYKTCASVNVPETKLSPFDRVTDIQYKTLDGPNSVQIIDDNPDFVHAVWPPFYDMEIEEDFHIELLTNDDEQKAYLATLENYLKEKSVESTR